MSVSPAAQLTPEALSGFPRPTSGRHYELSDGELIVVGNAGALQELIETRFSNLLTEYRLKTRSGRAFARTQFTLQFDRARIPEVAWVSEPRLHLTLRENRAIPIAPDLTVEIISDSEQPEESEQRLRDYLEADTEVWQVFPSTQTVTIWHSNQGLRLAQDQLVTSERLPGFQVPVSDIFEA